MMKTVKLLLLGQVVSLVLSVVSFTSSLVASLGMSLALPLLTIPFLFSCHAIFFHFCPFLLLLVCIFVGYMVPCLNMFIGLCLNENYLFYAVF